MTAPTISKAYEFNVNNAIQSTGSAQTEHRRFLLAMKDALVGFSNTPWSIAGSGDVSTGGMDAVDRWTSEGALLWNQGGGTGSWIVFNMQQNRQICLHLSTSLNTTPYRGMRMWLSAGGLFTGGTAGLRPTAVDEYGVSTGDTAWLDNATSSSGAGYYLHLIHSTDGEVTHVIGGRGGYTQFWLADIKLQDPVAGWDHPYVFRWDPGSSPTTNNMTYSRNRGAQLWRGITTIAGGGTNFVGAASCEGWLSNAVGENIASTNDMSGEWPITPAAFASNSGAGMGRHGIIPDVWYGSTGLNTGDTIEDNPNVPTRLLAQFSHVILPWNGTVPRVN